MPTISLRSLLRPAVALLRSAFVAALVVVLGVAETSAQVLVRDISPGGDTNFGDVKDANGLLFFGANNRLWRSDGTEAGTFAVSESLRSRTFAIVNGIALFGAYHQFDGYELWRSDGTVGGTFQLRDIVANGHSSPDEFVLAGNYVYFLAAISPPQAAHPPQLWRSDGTDAGTTLVKSFAPAEGVPSGLVAVGDRVFFDTVATNGVASVWRSDGTTAGTIALRGFPDAWVVINTYRTFVSTAAVGDTFYFSHYTQATGIELWKSDGTVAGTVMVEDLVPGTESSIPAGFTDWNGALAFIATPPSGDDDEGVVWRSGGTAATTEPIDLTTGVLPFFNTLHPLGPYLLFTGFRGSDHGLFRTDGTPAGTTFVSAAGINYVASVQRRRPPAVTMNGVTYYGSWTIGNFDSELWRTDGTPAGTSRVVDLWPGTTGSTPSNLVDAGGALYFTASDGITGYELWRIGTPVITLPPIAVPDAHTTAANTTLTVPAPGVLGNDVANGGAMTAALASGATSGTLMFNGTGGFSFTPVAGFSGVVTFSYRTETANGQSAPATVTITVTPPPAPVPTSQPDSYSTPMGVALTILAPGVLANDNSNGGGTMTAAVASTVTHGTLTLLSTGGFTYRPPTGYVGADSFAYRASNASGAGAVTTVNLTVSPLGVQPPTGLYVSMVTGNVVTLRWTPPSSGPVPTGYVFEGGTAPGQALATMSTGMTAPVFTIEAPTGTFFVRIRTVAGSATSGPSNEVRIYPGQGRAGGAPPARSGSPVGMANGRSVALAWRESFDGGEATNVILDVTGTLSVSMPLGRTNSFVFDGVPPGTYTFRTRAQNPAGTSGPSDPVTLTFPAPCTGVPLPPENFLAYRMGNVVHVVWDPAASGAAPTSYVLIASGSFNGALPMATRSISAPVGPGSYTLRVRAANACGVSGLTAAQTVVVP